MMVASGYLGGFRAGYAQIAVHGEEARIDAETAARLNLRVGDRIVAMGR